jgi:hypothetical protein
MSVIPEYMMIGTSGVRDRIAAATSPPSMSGIL